MRHPSPFPNIVRLVAVVLLVIVFVQALPMLMRVAGIASPQALQAAPSGNGYYAAAPVNTAGLWDIVKTVLAVILIGFVARIWFLLERIAARLERNKVDVNLTLKKDY